ncbi:hypothetical protein P5763_07470 [Bacillus cereus]|uniref:hypothetical protein n=1 Tax=Bacillus cereus TaxID=1396 RepID=UPI0024050289|nr:hypothetical protein [Bacillus cereus]MDF9611911.1 hypothetical protein [Bacillus cereus]
MDALIELAIKNLLNKDTVFLGLFLVGYYVQYVDKKEQKQFILDQQDVLVRLTRSVEKIEARGEMHEKRLERIEDNLINRD